jgi:hypothetical protein
MSKPYFTEQFWITAGMMNFHACKHNARHPRCYIFWCLPQKHSGLPLAIHTHTPSLCSFDIISCSGPVAARIGGIWLYVQKMHMFQWTPSSLWAAHLSISRSTIFFWQFPLSLSLSLKKTLPKQSRGHPQMFWSICNHVGNASNLQSHVISQTC